jgi:hypothetical protein
MMYLGGGLKLDAPRRRPPAGISFPGEAPKSPSALPAILWYRKHNQEPDRLATTDNDLGVSMTG